MSKAGVAADAILASLEAGVFDDFERDERGPTLSIARVVILDANTPMADPRVRLVPLENLPELPFDHRAIVAKAATVLLDSLWIHLDTTRALLGDTFDTVELIARKKELAAAAGLPVPETANIGRALGRTNCSNVWRRPPQLSRLQAVADRRRSGGGSSRFLPAPIAGR